MLAGRFILILCYFSYELFYNKKGTRSKKDDKKRKSSLSFENSWEEYIKFMEANLVKKRNHQESPHMVISKSFCDIQNNSITLKGAYVDDDASRYRKICYEIDQKYRI